MSYDPYQPPQYKNAGNDSGIRPQVCTWHAVYCTFMALLYLGMIGMGVVFFLNAESLAADARDKDPLELKIMGVMFTIISVPLVLLFGITPLLRKGKLAWVMGIVTICIGLTSPCCMPVTIPLLIFWLKPETKAYLNAN